MEYVVLCIVTFRWIEKHCEWFPLDHWLAELAINASSRQNCFDFLCLLVNHFCTCCCCCCCFAASGFLPYNHWHHCATKHLTNDKDMKYIIEQSNNNTSQSDTQVNLTYRTSGQTQIVDIMTTIKRMSKELCISFAIGIFNINWLSISL